MSAWCLTQASPAARAMTQALASPASLQKRSAVQKPPSAKAALAVWRQAPAIASGHGAKKARCPPLHPLKLRWLILPPSPLNSPFGAALICPCSQLPPKAHSQRHKASFRPLVRLIQSIALQLMAARSRPYPYTRALAICSPSPAKPPHPSQHF